MNGRPNATRSARPEATASTQAIHISESTTDWLVASEAARLASLRSMAEIDWASDCALAHWLA